MKAITLALVLSANVALANSGYDDGNTIPAPQPSTTEERICETSNVESVQVRGLVQKTIHSGQSCLLTVDARGLWMSANASHTFKLDLLQNGFRTGVINAKECDTRNMVSPTEINNIIVKVLTVCKRTDKDGRPISQEVFTSLHLD